MRSAALTPSVRALSAALALAVGAGADAGITTFTFTGAGSALWNDPLVWDLTGVPNSNLHNAVIDANPGAATTLTLNVSVALNDFSYFASDVQFISQGRQITLGGTATFDGGQPVVFNGGGITGLGTVNNHGTFNANGSVGLLHEGVFTNLGGAVLQISNGNLTRNTGGLLNQGTINVTSTGVANSGIAGSGMVTNEGTINFEAGMGGARRFDNSMFNASGATINVMDDTTLGRTSGVYTNEGAFNTFAGTTTTLNGTGVLMFNQDGGTLDNQGVFTVAGETFNFNGGVITGNDIVLTSGNLNVTTPNAGNFDVTGGTTMTGDISNQQSVDVINTTLTQGDFTNDGTLTLTSTGVANSQLNAGTLTNTGTLDLLPGGGGDRTLNSNLINSGTVNASDNTALNNASGVYTNSGNFNVAMDTTTTLNGTGVLNFNQNGGTLDNQGTFTVQGEAFNFNGGVITGNDIQITSGNLNINTVNAGNFDITGGTTMSGDISNQQSVDVINSTLTQGDFTNDGTLTLTSTGVANSQLNASTLTNTGVLDLLPGGGGDRTLNTSLSNSGTVNASDNTALNRTSGAYTNTGDFNVALGTTTTLNGSGVLSFNQDGGTLNNQGVFTVAGETFNFNGGVITGNDIRITSGNLNITTANAGNFDITGGTTMSGDISNQQTVDVFNATLTQGDFTNDGTLTLTSTGVANSQLNAGTLTNTGVLDLLPGGGGDRTLNTSLINSGTVNASDNTALNRTSGAYTNTGDFNVALGTTTTLNGSGVLSFNQDGGELANQGVFTVGGEIFNFNGGVITGNDIRITSGNLNITTTNAGNFDVTGGTTMSGDISNQQTVDIINTTLTQTDFTNNGTLTLTSTGAANSQLTAGTLTNTGTVDLLPGVGGDRMLSTNLINNGSVNVDDNTTLNKANGTQLNNGLIEIASSATLTVGGSGTVSFTNDTAGSIRGDGALSLVSVDVFVNNGLFGPGADDGSNSAGSLQVNGDWSATGDAVLEIDIFANDSRGVPNDSINISRDGSLGGDLVVNVLGSPRASDTFVILTAADVLGTFANATSQVVTTNGGVFDVTYTPTQVILSNFVPTPGAIGLVGIGALAGLGRRRA